MTKTKPYKRQYEEFGRTVEETNHSLLALCPICNERLSGGYFTSRTVGEFKGQPIVGYGQTHNEVALVNHVLQFHRDAPLIEG